MSRKSRHEILLSSLPGEREGFWDNVEIKKPDECWEWKLSKNGNGYGAFTLCGVTFPAHRVAYFYYHNRLDPKLLVCHGCDNRPCCNPAHLMLGTVGDNSADASSHKRLHYQTKTHCVSGHEFTPENIVYNKLGGRRCRKCKAIQQKKNNDERAAVRAIIRAKKKADRLAARSATPEERKS